MDLKDILAVSGMGGLFELVSQRADGLIVKSMEDGKTKFASSRMHDFSPLESITLYTESDEGIELKKVFETMKEKEGLLKVPHPKKDSSDAIRGYFREIVPDFDEDRVYTSDFKKLIKWYNLLDGMGKVTLDDREETTEEESTVEDAEIVKETKESDESEK